MKTRSLEVVTEDVDAACATYVKANDLPYGELDAGPGNARRAAPSGEGWWARVAG
ncbi:MAG: hypothetical protein KDD47_10320 [Acidobacteria bacterium]|nr:hypothetical protein [Acidobacteriota bacterium]